MRASAHVRKYHELLESFVERKYYSPFGTGLNGVSFSPSTYRTHWLMNPDVLKPSRSARLIACWYWSDGMKAEALVTLGLSARLGISGL